MTLSSRGWLPIGPSAVDRARRDETPYLVRSARDSHVKATVAPVETPVLLRSRCVHDKVPTARRERFLIPVRSPRRAAHTLATRLRVCLLSHVAARLAGDRVTDRADRPAPLPF